MRDGTRWDHCFKSLRLCSDLNGTWSDAHPVALAIEPLFVLFLLTSRFMAVVEFLNLVTGCHRNSGIFWETKVSFGRHCSCGRWNQGNGQISSLIMLSVPFVHPFLSLHIEDVHGERMRGARSNFKVFVKQMACCSRFFCN